MRIVQIFENSPLLNLGLSDQGEEGNFRWLSDSSDVTYSNWGKNEPNNTGGKQGATVITGILICIG